MYPTTQTPNTTENIMLLGVALTGSKPPFINLQHPDFQLALNEASELVKATGGNLVDISTCQRTTPHPALFIGTGKAQELAEIIKLKNIQLVIVNDRLSPTQERNLEKALQCRVIDRVGLILAIFAQRARTQEGKLQVELAQLQHLSSRLVRGYGHLKSQRGGIGLKGPGETQLETDRRLIAQKIDRLKKQLANVKKQRATQRKNRQQNHIPILALVGYTNVGKSTLFNSLTKANVLAKDQLFATLDTTARRVWLNENSEFILTDTVGFIRDLPHELIASFSATLEETTLADILLHVTDASHPDSITCIDHVNDTLKEIGAEQIRQIIIYNKIDKLANNQPEILRNTRGEIEAIRLSTLNKNHISLLRQMLSELLSCS